MGAWMIYMDLYRRGASCMGAWIDDIYTWSYAEGMPHGRMDDIYGPIHSLLCNIYIYSQNGNLDGNTQVRICRNANN